MLDNLSKQIMLEAWGAQAVRAALYDDVGIELALTGYARQTIGWTWDNVNVILNANLVMGEDYIARFVINPDPTVTVSTVKYLTDTGSILATHELGNDAETYNNPGNFDILSASHELV